MSRLRFAPLSMTHRNGNEATALSAVPTALPVGTESKGLIRHPRLLLSLDAQFLKLLPQRVGMSLFHGGELE